MTTTERLNDRTREHLATMDTATKLIREHGLHAGMLVFEPSSPGAFRYDQSTQDWTLPVIPKVKVILYGLPHEFLRWCHVIAPEGIHVRRRDFDTCLRANADVDGLTWNLASSVSRLGQGPHLPGISPDWKRLPSGRRGNEAWISVEDFATTLSVMAGQDGQR